MPPRIFLSWSAPDKTRVLPLRDRLRTTGLPTEVWEYSDNMPAGADISDQVRQIINSVEIAIICFSDATVKREWIVREAEWCFKTMKDGNHRLRQIIPVWVGPHPKNKVPDVLKGTSTFDISDGDEASIAGFITNVFEQLGREAPRIIPAAIFAMTRLQCKKLLANKKTAADLAKLCATAGMPPGVASLLVRYGDEPEDLAPFEAGKPLLAIIDEVLERANSRRVQTGSRPIFLHWMRSELVGPKKTDTARRQWAESDSLLIVDSISAYVHQIQKQLLELPESKYPERASLLWLPPYTQHTAMFEQVLAPAVAMVPRLADLFNDWKNIPLRAMSFDTSTLAAARLWLHRAFLDVSDQLEPVAQTVERIETAARIRVRLDEMLRHRPGGGP